jgi:site-specific DNA-methyltransferase (adenine-specific)
MKKSAKPELARKVRLIDIVVGDRHRRDMGDLESLANSIGAVGLLQPVVITEEGGLVAGERRLRAVALLGWQEVPAYVVRDLDDAAALLRAERDENVCRKEFAPSEAVSLGRALEALEREAARQRQEATRARKGEKVGAAQGGGKKPPPCAANGKVRELVAEALGMSGRTYAKARKVVEAAEADPGTFGDLPGLMDQTGRVHQAFQEMARRKKRVELDAKAAAATPAAPGRCRVIRGDCLEALPKLPARTARLIFADSPYNLGIDYGEGEGADRLPDDEYLDLTRRWMTECARLLAPDGSLWVLIGPQYAAHFDLLLQEVGLHLRGRIVWHETFGQNCADNFNKCHRCLLYAVKDPGRFVFHADAVTRPSDRQAIYGDKRADPGGKLWDDVWGVNPPIPRLTGTCAGRLPDFPTQLPLALLRPIVGCASDPGDLVLDPFCGSATTGVAAVTSGRRFLGIERNPEFARLARLRLKGVALDEPGGVVRHPGIDD